MAKILIIDDDQLIRNSLSRCFGDMGHEVLTAESLGQGMAFSGAGVDIIYLDLNLPDGDGHKAIHDLAVWSSRPEIIILTGLRDHFGAQETLGCGAWDYIQKPASPSALRSSLESALAYRRNRRVEPEPGTPFDDCGIVGEDLAMRRAKQIMARAAESEAGVLIRGETGVGKELAAQAIHANSPRRKGPFITVDCSNLTETLLESVLYGHRKGAFTGAHTDHTGLVAEADGGTLFLDEIGELPLSLQKAFLRVLQEHRFRPVGSNREQSSDFRLVAATGRDLEAMTRLETFRGDLLFRLRTVEIVLPPLRERGADILLLADYFVEKACHRYGIEAKSLSRELREMVSAYAWPGNVREMGHVMEAAVIEAGKDPVMVPKHLPSHIRLSCLDRDRVAGPALPPTPAIDKTLEAFGTPAAMPESPEGTANPGAPAAVEASTGSARIQPYAEYKAERDRAYFQELMEICDHDSSSTAQFQKIYKNR